MLEIKRYKVGYLGLEEAKNGQYVKHGDYLEEVMALRADVARLRSGLEAVGEHARQMFVDGWKYGWVACTEDSQEHCDELLKNVERLVKAL